MKHETRQAILDHAEREFPRESCGLIVQAESGELYHACKNLAENQRDFILDPAGYIEAEDLGKVTAVVHSHPNVSPKPSQADLVACEASGLPWYIVSVPVGSWEYLEPKGYRAPLLGREFAFGVLDCFSLVRDWYFQEQGRVLPDLERTDEEWYKHGQNLYMDHFYEFGFEEAKGPIERGDVILMQIGSDVVNHAAIYLGGDVMLHHLMRQLSCRDVYGGYWKKHTRMIVRLRK